MLLYPKNDDFLSKKSPELHKESQSEIIKFLNEKLKTIRFGDIFLENNTYFLLIGTLLWLFVIGIGIVNLLYLSVASLPNILSSEDYTTLLYRILTIGFGLIIFRFFWYPFFSRFIYIVKHIVAHTSAERMYLHLLKYGEPVEGMVKNIQVLENKKVINFAYFPKIHPGTRQGQYITSSQQEIIHGERISVLHLDRISVVL